MDAVNTLVHEGRDHHRHPEQGVPGEMEAGQRVPADMGQFMNETAGPVERQHRDQAEDDGETSGLNDDCASKRSVADRHGCQKIGPVDRRLGRVEISRDLGGRADQLIVLGNRHRRGTQTRICFCLRHIIRRDGRRTHKHLHDC